MAGLAGFVLGIIVIGAAAGAYLLPTLIAVIRHVPNAGSVAVINILLGWTFVGWVAALAMSVRSQTPPPPPPVRAFGEYPELPGRRPPRSGG
jgi:hypothetical protein